MQANLGQNIHPNPRTKLIKDKLIALQKNEVIRTHESLADRTGYTFKHTEIHITAVGYADDLTPMSTTP
jgi:hypothetical protein